MPGASVAVARRQLAQQFRRCGLDTPELDARLLVATRSGSITRPRRAGASNGSPPKDAGAIAALAARRLAREPVARILGRKEFWGLPLQLNADTLVPRPETETVVEAALAAIGSAMTGARSAAAGGRSRHRLGRAPAALLSELPAAFGIGTDVSAAALACARANADAARLAGRARSSPATTAPRSTGRSIWSSPIRPMWHAARSRRWRRRCATSIRAARSTAGPMGSTAIAAIAADARRLLAPGGTWWWSLAPARLAAVTALSAPPDWASRRRPRHDLAGVARALVMRPLP